MDDLSELTIQQKVGASLLLVFGVLSVSLGGLQLRNQIYTPFAIEPQAQAQKALSEFFNDEEARLRRLDTDKDGLSDYNELNVHQTSPYIKDTDSDGLTDKEEIDQGTDPLCPQDEECEQRTINNVTSSEEVGFQTFANLREGKIDDLSQQQKENFLPGSKLKSIVNNPDELRKLMLQRTNISKEKLEQIDDETLKKQAKQLLRNKTGISTNENLTSTSKSNNETTSTESIKKDKLSSDKEAIQKLLNNPDKLRQFLLETGKISEEQLQKIDDKTLIEEAKKILKNQNKN